jgi:hypothetical protein
MEMNSISPAMNKFRSSSGNISNRDDKSETDFPEIDKMLRILEWLNHINCSGCLKWVPFMDNTCQKRTWVKVVTVEARSKLWSMRPESRLNTSCACFSVALPL